MSKKWIIVLAAVLGVLVLAGGILYMVLESRRGRDDGDYEEVITGEDLTQYFDPTLTNEAMVFTHFILNQEDFDRIIPLGQINPPGHTFPTDHIYFVVNGAARPLYAPTGGKVLLIEEPGDYGDRAIRIGVTDTKTYYLGHIFINENLQAGDIVSAGDQIGVSGNTSCVDFGVLNKNINNGFLNQKYPVSTLYGDKPLSYYEEPLKIQLYDLVLPPIPGDLQGYVYDEGVTDGEFALDRPGSLQGNWFLENCFTGGWYEWSSTLSFGTDVYFPDQIRIGIGSFSNAFAVKNEDNPVRPEDVSVATGIVAYALYNANNTTLGLPTANRVGLLMVQMLSDTRLKLEYFNDTTSTSLPFTDAALIYVR